MIESTNLFKNPCIFDDCGHFILEARYVFSGMQGTNHGKF